MQPEAMVRGTVLRGTDGHRSKLPLTHDLNLWLRLAVLGDVARIQGADQGYYRVHPSSLLRSRFGGNYADLTGRRAAFDDFFDTLDPAVAETMDIDCLRAENCRTLARHALRYAVRAFDTGTTGTEPVDDYLAFARDVFPDSTSLREWRELAKRKDIGPERAAVCRSFRQAERLKVLQDSLQWRRWRRYGT